MSVGNYREDCPECGKKLKMSTLSYVSFEDRNKTLSTWCENEECPLCGVKVLRNKTLKTTCDEAKHML